MKKFFLCMNEGMFSVPARHVVRDKQVPVLISDAEWNGTVRGGSFSTESIINYRQINTDSVVVMLLRHPFDGTVLRCHWLVRIEVDLPGERPGRETLWPMPRPTCESIVEAMTSRFPGSRLVNELRFSHATFNPDEWPGVEQPASISRDLAAFAISLRPKLLKWSRHRSPRRSPRRLRVAPPAKRKRQGAAPSIPDDVLDSVLARAARSAVEDVDPAAALALRATCRAAHAAVGHAAKELMGRLSRLVDEVSEDPSKVLQARGQVCSLGADPIGAARALDQQVSGHEFLLRMRGFKPYAAALGESLSDSDSSSQ
jgi:hypothetical protein